MSDYATGPGTGNVVGPASSTDNAIPRFDGATGTLLQGSGAFVSDAGIVSSNGARFDFPDGSVGYTASVGAYDQDGGSGFKLTRNIQALTADKTLTYINASGRIAPQAASSLQTATGNGETINTAGVTLARYKTNGAARTGVILQAGTYDSQEVTVINEDTTAVNSITFAVVATSNVANGVTSVINGLQGRKFIWSANATTPAWYECN